MVFERLGATTTLAIAHMVQRLCVPPRFFVPRHELHPRLHCSLRRRRLHRRDIPTSHPTSLSRSLIFTYCKCFTTVIPLYIYSMHTFLTYLPSNASNYTSIIYSTRTFTALSSMHALCPGSEHCRSPSLHLPPLTIVRLFVI